MPMNPLESTEAAIEKESDIHLESIINTQACLKTGSQDTDIGRQRKGKIASGNASEAYHTGLSAKSPCSAGFDGPHHKSPCIPQRGWEMILYYHATTFSL